MTFLLAFLVFVVAVTAMAVGVIFAGKRLRGSCGGVGPDGGALGDCLCARKDQGVCASEDDSGLVEIAELGYPKRALRRGRAPRAESSDEPPLEV